MVRYNIFFTLLFCFVLVSGGVLGADKTHVFENERIQLVINLENGALELLENRITGWKIIPEGEGRSFEMTVRDKQGRLHRINAERQEKPEYKICRDSLVFTWPRIRIGNPGSELDIAFRGIVTFSQSEGVIFSGEVDNRSDCVVEGLNWPAGGDISLFEDGQLLFRYVSYTALKSVELYPRIASYSGACDLPEHSFLTVGNDRQGIYMSSKDYEMREHIRLSYSISPSAGYLENAGLPLAGKDNQDSRLMNYRIGIQRDLYLQPGTSVQLVDFVVNPYAGDWQQAADQYKAWRSSWFKAPHRPDWLKRVNTWQQLQINSSESNINFHYKDLPDYARDCKKYGVDAIQLTGWTRGGQDRGLPSHDTDPRLGTTEDFKQAIAQCEKMGVHIMLFTKFTWAELTSPLYQKYKDCIAHNWSGDECQTGGYRYNTYTQMQHFNNRRFGVLCFSCPKARKLICDEFQKCLDLGASGMVYDENQHHAGVKFCSNPNHGHKVPAFIYHGTDQLGREFQRMVQKHSPEFVMTGEGPYDIQLQYYMTYMRATVGHIPVMRYIDSEQPIVCAITDHFDLNRVNMCLKDKYIMSYEPRNFKGCLNEFPRVIAYGRKVDDLRRRYADYLWDAGYCYTQGAAVSGQDLLYSVFRRKNDGKRAVVVMNKNINISSKAEVHLPDATGELRIVTPAHPDSVLFTGEVEIGSQGVAVILEM